MRERFTACSDISGGQEGPVVNYESSSHAFHALMSFKVREILLVSSLYDAFVIEEEGLIPELVLGEYAHLHLSSPPRVTRVSSGETALSLILSHSYDLVITMTKNIGMDPFDFGNRIKAIYPELPVVLLATDTSDLYYTQQKDDEKGIDKTFFWNGDSDLFLAIIKYIEDRNNARFDTINGGVRIIIMVEDSVRYYSMFLPIIYTELVRQTQHLMSEELNEMQALLRKRARPKILLAETFEEGMELYEEYRGYVLGIISDVNYKHHGRTDPGAGYKFIRAIKKRDHYMPTLLQSSDPENREKADSAGAYFLHKNSPTLLQDFRHFLLNNLGFGNFTFLMPKDEKDGIKDEKDGMKDEKDEVKDEKDGIKDEKDEKDEVKDEKDGIKHDPVKDLVEKGEKQPWKRLHDSTIKVGWASNLREFERLIQEIPLESVRFHCVRNNFSNWLMARGESKLAEKLRPRKISDFNDIAEIRDYLHAIFNKRRREKHLGVITDFPQQDFEFDSSFTRLGEGSLGGKGKGIAFMRALLARNDLQMKYENITVSVPSTLVIGTDEFDRFIEENKLHSLVDDEHMTDSDVARIFLKSRLSVGLKEDLESLLRHFTSPLAVRSSSLLEDSQNHPFAGIYSTYMLPNNHDDEEIRMKQLCQAIKLVYASVFYRDARTYIEATASKTEEEKMAVIIQQVVGREYEGRFYPTFSGVAQSHNFYPVSHQKHEDGIAAVAVGLGKSVVGGETTLRFSPKHPGIIPEFSSPDLIIKNSQRKLYVLNTGRTDFDLSEKDDVTLEKLDVGEVEKDGTLDLVASTYDRNDGRIRDSLDFDGPRLITFAGILKYDAIPLTSLLRDILEIGSKGMGCHVEIEFAATVHPDDGKRPEFSILQIRPIVASYEHLDFEWDDSVDRDSLFIQSDKALGNGIIETIRDVVYVPSDTFDPAMTVEIAREVGEINKDLVASSSPYLLIGPGRWGTVDRWLGIPVGWSQISGVKVMVETALEKFNIEPSQGTHFFQNITSRKIGYITIPYNSAECFMDGEWLNAREPRKSLEFVRHVRLPSPIIIKLDGRCGGAQILKPGTSGKKRHPVN